MKRYTNNPEALRNLVAEIMQRAIQKTAAHDADSFDAVLILRRYERRAVEHAREEIDSDLVSLARRRVSAKRRERSGGGND